jgi:hypothetical protein
MKPDNKKNLYIALGIVFLIIIAGVVFYIFNDRQSQDNQNGEDENTYSLIEIRRVIQTTMPKDEPGDDKPDSDVGAFATNTEVFVFKEQGKWLMVKPYEESPFVYWIKKEFTVPESIWETEYQENETTRMEKLINSYKENGLVTNIINEGNEVLVNGELWENLDNKSKEEFCSIFSQYFNLQRGFTRVEVIDAKTGKRLARYNTGLGLQLE